MSFTDRYLKHRAIRIATKTALAVLCVVFAVLFFAVCFLNFHAPLGGGVSAEDRQEYARRASNYQNGVFSNEGEFVLLRPSAGNDPNTLSQKGVRPAADLPTVTPDLLSSPAQDDFTFTWLGHSSLLLQIHGLNVLFDPVLGERSSPVSFLGPKRFGDPPVTAAQLPHIDLAIYTHDHYDHLDYGTLKEIDGKTDAYVVPLGVENHLERWGVAPEKITNLAWGEEYDFRGLKIACTPARHYSGRSINDRFFTLWASFALFGGGRSVYVSGDTGYDAHFRAIAEKYGTFDLAFLDGAQYDPRWPEVHMSPEEAFVAATELGVKYAVPVHWGAFALANHPWDDSVERLLRAAENSPITIVTPKLGETARYDQLSSFTERWWREIP